MLMRNHDHDRWSWWEISDGNALECLWMLSLMATNDDDDNDDYDHDHDDGTILECLWVLSLMATPMFALQSKLHPQKVLENEDDIDDCVAITFTTTPKFVLTFASTFTLTITFSFSFPAGALWLVSRLCSNNHSPTPTPISSKRYFQR